MIEEGSLLGFDDYWAGSFRGGSVFVLAHGVLRPASRGSSPDLHVPGTLFARLTDHHVHLGLIDPEAVMAGGITSVVDLGGVPPDLARLRTESLFPGSMLPEIHMAGAFLTCVAGYPRGRDWAPHDAVVELRDAREAEGAVTAQVRGGASLIKVTLNANAGPVPDADLLDAIVRAARGAGVPVAAHVEGEGMTRRALDAGVNVLAHAPFTERLGPELIARMSRAGTRVVSTLDIHGRGEPTDAFATASANIRHLVAAGCHVLYGTDLGNGPLPVGVNERELTALVVAGLDRDALVTAIAGGTSGEGLDSVGPRLAWVPGRPPQDAAETAHWLAAARATTVDYLEETLP